MSHLGLTSGTVVRVKYDFKSTSDNALDLEKGEFLVVMPTKDEETKQKGGVSDGPVWVAGCKVGGESGYFPSNYVEIIGASNDVKKENRDQDASQSIERQNNINDLGNKQAGAKETVKKKNPCSRGPLKGHEVR